MAESAASNRPILIVVPEKRRQGVLDELHAKCTNGWEQYISLLAYPPRATSAEKTQRAKLIVSECRRRESKHVFIDRETACEQRAVSSQIGSACSKLDFYRLLEQLNQTISAFGLSWRDRVDAQLRSSGLKSTPIDDWLRQFDHFDAIDVGREVIKQLELLEPNDVVKTFNISSSSLIGTDSYYTYFDDGDVAGSDASTKQTLLHLYAENRVAEVRALLESEGSSKASHIYVFADGLWSGSEFCKRVNALSPLLLSSKGRRIRFKYSIVTDFGLIVARHAIRHYQLLDVDVEVQESTRVVKILGNRLAEAEELQAAVNSPEELFNRLHQLVEPMVFHQPERWVPDVIFARNFLAGIGQQLVTQWIRRELEREQRAMSDDAIAERATKFALGGGGFGLVAAFHQSVPKVTLPIIWLGGNVDWNQKSLKWKPLLYDSRRD